MSDNNQEPVDKDGNKADEKDKLIDNKEEENKDEDKVSNKDNQTPCCIGLVWGGFIIAVILIVVVLLIISSNKDKHTKAGKEG